MRPRIRAVDFVNNHNGRKPCLERFAKHVTGLRKRAFTGIDQQHHSINHLQRPLHLTTEIAVPGRIHDIDLHALIENRRVLGQNGDAALAFQFIRIHNAFHHGFIGAECPTLF